jgi:uncharacterized membrane protein HdeD (DUF308 family)
MRNIMSDQPVQQLWKWGLVSGVLTIVLGAIVLAWPGPTIGVASALFGVYLLVSGFVQLFMAFTLPRATGTRVLLFISGALSVVLAIMSFRNFGEGYAVLLLSLWIGISFVFQGVSESAIGITTPGLPGRGWYTFLGIMSVIAGVVVLIWPFDSIVALTFAAGIWLLILGVIQIVRAFQVRKDANVVRETIDSVSDRVTAQ